MEGEMIKYFEFLIRYKIKEEDHGNKVVQYITR